MKNHRIDIVKGILILLVILGHIIQGSFTESLPRFIIYGFHMPLFMALSGYLFSNHFNKIPTQEWIKKSYSRAVLPWLLAMIVFTVFLRQVGFYNLPWASLIIEVLIKPFYHLWFIPAWLTYQAVLRLAQKYHLPHHTLLKASILLSVFCIWLETSGQPYIQSSNFSPFQEILNLLRPQFFAFYTLGYTWRNHKNTNLISLLTPLKQSNHTLIATLLFVGLFHFRNSFPQLVFTNSSLYLILFCYLNLSLVSFVFTWMEADNQSNIPWLEWLGVKSLLIYLWHPLGILFARYFISYRPSPEFYFSTISSTFSIIILIYLYDRFRNA